MGKKYGKTEVHVWTPLIGFEKTDADRGDYSGDMIDQFAMHTGIELPADIKANLGDDCNENKARRGDWLWSEHPV